MKKDDLYNFIHIPKCAGSTIRKNALFNYSSEQVFEIYKLNNRDFGTRLGIENYIKRVNKDMINVNF